MREAHRVASRSVNAEGSLGAFSDIDSVCFIEPDVLISSSHATGGMGFKQPGAPSNNVTIADSIERENNLAGWPEATGHLTSSPEGYLVNNPVDTL
jgi:hypothetical protein